ncbi:endolytic transglycosylase MltG [Candidatus Curtissbacteria bacterium]|nr:endolytic transglycosylase MltG [Candidatus Curtissbacteria bacterium]
MTIKRSKFLIFATLFILLITTPIGLNLYYQYLLQPASKIPAKPQIFIIKPGQPVVSIAQNLEEAALIKNAFAFRLLVAQMGIGKTIQAGDFRLAPDMSSQNIAKELTHGAIDIWITFPEGLRKEEAAQIVESKLNSATNEKYQFEKKEFIELAQEGYMFPDTYLIPKDSNAKDIAERLRQTFDQKVNQKILESGQENNLSKEEVVILASLVERESKTSEERPVIAGILINRLSADIPLQVDATVQYAKGYDSAKNSWWPQVTQEDYQTVKSLYNTYLHPGLPPGPIASPGLESIRAAAAPSKTDYLYYLHDLDGKIHYAKTAEEHQQNVNEFL